MSQSRNSRREFLHKIACLACSGSAAALLPQLRMIGTALASTSSLTGYKALVCVYLAGGNDSWNMLVPNDASRYSTYSTSRGGAYNAATNPGGLALPTPGGGQVVTDGNDANAATNQYFLHPNLTNLTGLYNQQKLAFLVNAGTLVAPIDMTDYNGSSALHPPQLFSHADQEALWHQANTDAGSTLGWGGLCADNLQANGANNTTSPQLSLCVSISGANRFQVGTSVVPYQIASSGLNSLKGVCNPTCSGGASSSGVRDATLNALLADTYASDFAGEYANVFQRGRDLYGLLSPGLSGTTLNTTFPNTSLGNQLKMVAQMIKLSMAQNYATRQIYYVRFGGFDLHAGMFTGAAGDHADLLSQVDAALGAFWTAMGPTDVNSENNVVAFTASEFARTLQSNGSGSDHGWGGVQMVLGGGVHGGKLYSNGQGKISGFPDESLSAANNFSRGQMIPGISVDQYAATMAQWLGVAASDLSSIFPNLGNFGTNNLGFV
jgi:uncharacterized protein (DUF1501 family)